ncbi:MAG: ATP-dependent helicase [Candidatus Magasanikbacteria bacterium]|nr:ATP-dependent helicase [Candidatus Magasanikbacteria bacterium]
MIHFEDELNAEQLNVVREGDGPCLVLAGAGSGKTRTITYRVAYLIEQGIDPKNILLLTFTNKAAKEMTERVKLLLGAEQGLPWAGTFHHVAYRILRVSAPLIGLDHNFSILDSEDSLDLIKLSLKQEGIDRTQRRFPSPRVVHSIISYARNAEQTIESVLSDQHPKWLDFSDQITRVTEDYAKRKREANVMDFDDLLVNLYLLLIRSESLRNRYAAQFKYILVDEYQDTNKIQASIIRLFASVHGNVLVVGDDAQSIYSFRAADIQNILDFEHQYKQVKIFRLEKNYRSTPDILDLANEVIVHNERQYQKTLQAHVERFTKPELHAFADQSEEAEYIAERILELREEGVPLNGMAVLFRAAFHSQALEVELTKRDILYDYRGGLRFFERSHIKDVLAYLRIFANLDDSIAWSRVLNMQTGIGPASAGAIIQGLKNVQNQERPIILDDEALGKAEESLSGTELDEKDLASPFKKQKEIQKNVPRIKRANLSHIGALLPSRAQIGWNDFLQIWDEITKSDGSPAGLMQAVLHSKYADYLEAEYDNYRDRIQDIEQLVLFASRQNDLSRFLAEASMQESYAEAGARGSHYEDEQVVLSTIHQAKGLEWEVVFILNLSSGQFPNGRALESAQGLEEERRLLYVAVTRAKKQLYVSYPLMSGFSSVLGGPSMFLEELRKDLFDEHIFVPGALAYTGSVFSDPSDPVDDIEYLPEDEPFVSRNPKRTFLKSIDEL